MLRSEVKYRILDGINDSVTTPTLFTDAQLNDLIEEGAEIIVGETRSIRRSAIVPLRAGATFYNTQSIGDDMMLPYRIWNHSSNWRLTVASFDELDRFQQRWITTQTSPELWFPASWDLFGIWPTPASAGGLLRVDYFAWPRALMDDDDESELALPTHDALVLYGRYMGMLKGWDAQRALNVFKEFQQQEMFGKARSGIMRVKHRSFRRTDIEFPTGIRTEN